MSAVPAAGIVTLLTDFGLQDPFVGILKGVLLRHGPKLTVVDLSHGIPPQDVAAGAFYLSRSFHWFPAGTVHLCVVDPGVGSERAVIAASARGHYFFAPDNGLLADLLALDPPAEVRRVDLRALGLSPPSRTFHGRDVFAPLAARLASGSLSFESLGPECTAVVSAPTAAPVRNGEDAVGRVIVVDHFGNLISNLPAEWLRDGFAVEVLGKRLRRVGTYSEADPGECVALVNSFETVEIAMRDGHAARALGIGPGEVVRAVREGAS